MKFILFIFFIVVFSSCREKKESISLEAVPSKVVVYNYEDVVCQFIVPHLTEFLNEEVTDSVRFTTSYSFMDTKVSHSLDEFKNDTLSIEMRGDLMIEDSITETFTDKVDTISVIGELSCFFKNKIEKHSDTISIYLENPLKNNKMVGELKSGKREGLWLEYYDEELTELSRKSYFIEGKRHGVDSIYKNGRLHYLINWKKGQKHGSFKMLWPNGKIKWQTEYDNGEPVIPVYIFNSDGKQTGSFEL